MRLFKASKSRCTESKSDVGNVLLVLLIITSRIGSICTGTSEKMRLFDSSVGSVNVGVLSEHGGLTTIVPTYSFSFRFEYFESGHSIVAT